MNDMDKDKLKELRRKQYLEAKERRKNDPRYQEMLRHQKEVRKKAYQSQKEWQKEFLAKKKKTENSLDSGQNKTEIRDLIVRGSDLSPPVRVDGIEAEI